MPVRLVSQEEPLPGYRLLERLGRGGFGEVWKVEAPGGFLKAMKFVFGDLEAADEESRPAEQELKALDRVKLIRHPYILSLEQVQILEGQLIIIMELADRNLWDRFRECRSQGLVGIPREELLRYMDETAEALDLMNNHYRIQHLDIKPQNLFLLYNHVKVADFGLAKMFEGGRGTITGGVTPVYAAPETFEGYVSRFTDQYSLAIVFQELLTGVRPFNGTNTRQLLMQHINGTADLSPLSAADTPVVARGLSRKPDDRFPTCTDFVRALRAAGTNVAPVAAPAFVPVPGSDSAPRPAFGSGGASTRANLASDSNGYTKAQTPRPNFDAVARPTAGGSGASINTPMPALVTAGPHGLITPRMVAPTGPSAPALTLQRPQVFQTGRMAGLGLAPPEKTGDGALFPALVVGVGGVGRLVLQQLKRVIADRYGDPDKLPHVKFLYVDTDPAATAFLSEPAPGGAGLQAKEAYVAKLNRPAHYLSHPHLPAVDTWMPAGSLYRLPRGSAPADGVRAFGRLALLDHHRAISGRIRAEVEGFGSDDIIAQADKLTHLGLRSNRPRAYVIAGLGGGTGGGMFLDMAYLVRHEFRQAGYVRPDVVGVLFVPPAGKGVGRSTALANAHAGLTELYHFAAKRTRYQTAFDKADAPVVDTDGPFGRTAILELPKRVDPKEQAAVTGRAARALFHEILTPAGRVIDEVRDVYRNAFPAAGPTCQSFGLFRLSWPRPEVLAAATRRFAQRLLQRWTAKEAAHLRQPVSDWLSAQWDDRKLGFESLVAGFHRAAAEALRESPDKVFDAFIDPLRTRTPSSSKIDAAAACSVLDQLLKVVGKPESEDATAGTLAEALHARYEEVAKEAEGQLAAMAVSFIEQPQYRLAGAEEAVRQIGDRLKAQVDALEPVRADLDKEVRGLYGRMFQVIGGIGGGGLGAIAAWKSSVTGELLDLLRAYPRKRLQLHVLDMALSVYRKLQGTPPDVLRDITACRATLADIQTAVGRAESAGAVGPGKLILPDGAKGLDAAADLELAALSPDDLARFDAEFQRTTERKFRGLAAVCVKPKEKAGPFGELLLAKSREFLDAKLDKADPAAVFLRHYPEGTAGHPLVGEAFEEAAPDVKGRAAADEMMILAAPPGPAGDAFRAVVAEVFPGADLTPAPFPDDIVFHREHPHLDLAELPQLGEIGREAYQALTGSDHPPHTRADVPWKPAGGG